MNNLPGSSVTSDLKAIKYPAEVNMNNYIFQRGVTLLFAVSQAGDVIHEIR